MGQVARGQGTTGQLPGWVSLSGWAKLLMVTLGVSLSTGSFGATNSYPFTYANRTALLNDGWSFIATAPGGAGRNTEVTSGNMVSYDQVSHPGVLRIPCDIGDLWGGANNTRNSLFRALSTNWTSVRLQVSFAPLADGQQAHLMLYQDDDNYVEVGHAYSGAEVVALTAENGGTQASWSPLNISRVSVSASTLVLRLDRDLSTDQLTAFFSTDGNTWTTVGRVSHALVNPKVGIWTGGSSGGLPNCDLRRLDVITSDTALAPLLFVQPQHLVFNSIAGQACTNLQQLRLFARRALGSVSYTLTSDAPWLFSSVGSGTTVGTADISVAATGLGAGVYEGHLNCAGPGGSGAVATVTLIVNPAARARASTWQGARAGAMSVWVDRSNPTAYSLLSANGLRGSYMLMGGAGAIPAFATTYYNGGMELGSSTVDAPCFGLNEPALRYELEYNMAAISAATPQPGNNLVSLAWPCGFSTAFAQALAADYFLAARSYNVNQLEDPTPYNPMALKSFNAHGDSPAPPADFKTVVDAAIAQGKWFNMVVPPATNDDGAIQYTVGKDIWVAPAGTVSKYIVQRDRTVITNYAEVSGRVSFGCYRLPLDASPMRSFESAMTPQDTVTMQVDVTGIPTVTNLTVNGVTTTYTSKVLSGRTNLLFNLRLGGTVQTVTLLLRATSANTAPVLGSQPNRVLNEGMTLVVTNAGSDADLPRQTLSYSLPNAPVGAQIDTNGVIRWTPDDSQGPATYTLTTVVTDNGFPALSATNSFTVTVNEVNVAPVLPVQADRSLYLPEPGTLRVVNTALDPDLPANTLTYQLVAAPPGATIDANGIISWTPPAGQTPSTNLFKTVVQDNNPVAINPQPLSATNSFWVFVLPPHRPQLPTLTNLSLVGGTLLVVTNTATESAWVLATSNSFQFTYGSRSELFQDGWSFTATAPNGAPRSTEITDPADVRIISYDQVAHPGILRIPCAGGDLWGTDNTAMNMLFRYLPTNWLSLRLALALPASVDVQQTHLTLYQDDDNFLQVGLAYNTGLNPASNLVTTLVWERAGAIDHIVNPIGAVTNIHLRMDRNLVDNSQTGYYSFDGKSWLLIGTVNQQFVNPRLCIWAGGSQVPWVPGMANLDLRQLNMDLTASVPTVLSYRLLNPPAGATIDANGIIRWTTPPDAGTYQLTTVATDNAGQSATNTLTVTVSPPPPVLPLISDKTLDSGQTLVVTNTASSLRSVFPWVTNVFTFNYPDRNALTNDGWTFLARRATGVDRPTESPAPGPTAIFYNLSGALRIPCQLGDLWTSANNSTNSLFRIPPTNWVSARLNLSFSPTASYQQAHLGLYQDDDNYVQVGTVFNSGSGGLGATVDSEARGSFSSRYSALTPGTNSIFRLDRNLANNAISGFFSRDGTNWTSIWSVTPTLVNPRLAIWAGGGNTTVMPPADLRQLDLVLTNMGFVTLNYTLLNAPTNATISTTGVITWTPLPAQEGSTNVFTTVVADTGVPPMSATNTFTVVVRGLNQPPVLPVQPDRTLAGRQTLLVTNTATDGNQPPDSMTYQLLTAPAQASIDGNGIITWTPSLAQVPSTNVFTTVVTDYNPAAVINQRLSATNSFQVVVTTTHFGPTLPVQPNTAVAELTTLRVTNAAMDADIPMLGLDYTLLAGPPGASIDANGVITWTPSEAQGPMATVFTTLVTDRGTLPLSATNSFVAVAQEINQAPVLPTLTNLVLAGYELLVISNTATDVDLPANSLSYQLITGPNGALIDTNGVITWTPSAGQVPSTNLFTTVVTDSNPWAVNDQHLKTTNRFTVTVYPVRVGPLLPSQTITSVQELTTLTVTNTAEDADIPPPGKLSYSLLNPPSGATISSNGVITWTPSEFQGPGTNSLVTVVSDDGTPPLLATNSFSVVVQEVNVAPSLSVQTNRVLEGVENLTVSNPASDPDWPANRLSYQLAEAPSGAAIDQNGFITWTPLATAVPCTNRFTTVVTDENPDAINEQHLSVSNSFTVVVNATHNGPLLPMLSEVTMAESMVLTVTNTAFDNDAPPLGLNYRLMAAPEGATIDTNGVIAWTPTELQGPSTNVFTTLVFDNGTPIKSDLKSFTVVLTENNVPPVLPLQTNRLLWFGTETLAVTNTATDSDLPVNSLSYRLLAPPAGATITSNGVITWAPALSQVPSTNVITTVVTDGNPWAANESHLSATNSFTVVVCELNHAPVLPLQTNCTLTGCERLLVTNTASDADLPANPLTYSFLTAPAGATLDPNGIISWLPSLAQVPSTNVITTVVTDENPRAISEAHLSATNSFVVVVNAIHHGPVLPELPELTVNELAGLRVTNTAADTDVPVLGLTYLLVNAPVGMSIDTNGIISWSPDEGQGPSTNVVTTLVTDTGVPPLSASNTLTLVVQELNVAPVLPEQTNRVLVGLEALTVTNGATDLDQPANSLSYRLVNSPTGASIDTNGVIAWSPAPDQVPSTNMFETVVSDSNPWAVNAVQLSATNRFTVVAQAIHNGPVLPEQPSLLVLEHNSLTVTNTASATNVPHLAFSYALVSPPAGMTISSNGLISWTPSELAGPSTNVVTTVVTDGGMPPLSATNHFTVVVQENNEAPVLPVQPLWTLAGLQPLVVTNTALDVDLPANPLLYQLLAGPEGAAIDANGIITWTPAYRQVPSTNEFVTAVTDSNPWAVNAQQLSATNRFTVVVAPVHEGPSLLGQADRALDEGATLSVVNTASDSDLPALKLTYSLLQAPAGATINKYGIIAWTPAEADGPSTNVFTTVVTDSGVPPLSATNSFTVLVNELNQAPVLPPQFDRTLTGREGLCVTNTASDADLSANGLNYRFQTAPEGATIDNNGVIRWLPAAAQVPSTNLFETVVTDDNPTAIDAQHLSATNRFVVVVYATHNGPVLPEQMDLALDELATLTLTNTATDTDLPVLGLSYSLVDAPAGMLIDTNGIITWTPSEAQGPSTNVITTVVTDTGEPPLSATNSFTLVVNELNVAPVLPAQSDLLRVFGLETLLVTNQATDADLPANSLGYQLVNPPAGAAIDSQGVITWSPVAAQVPSTNVITTVVTDSSPSAKNEPNLSATNSFTVVFIYPIHNGPVMPEQTNLTVTELTTLWVTNTAASADIPAFAFSYTLLEPPPGASIDTNGIITWTPTENQGPSTNIITTVATDAGEPPLSVTNHFTVVVQELNVAPVLSAQPDHLLTGVEPLLVTNAATDEDLPANGLSYRLLAAPTGAAIDPNGVITWTPTPAQVPSTNLVETMATDDNPWAINEQHLSATNRFTVVLKAIHNGPVLPEQTNLSLPELTTLVVTNTASDGDIPSLALEYRLVEAPADATIDADGVIRWTPSELDGPSTNAFTTVVTDAGEPPLSATNHFLVVVEEINSQPLLPSQSDVTLVGRQSLVVTNSAADTDLPGNSLTYHLVRAPEEALIDTNGVISWTPAVAQVPSTNVFETVVTDDNPWAVNEPHLNATNRFTVVVKAIHDGPVLPSQTNLTIAELTSLLVTNAASDSDLPVLALSYSLIDPPGGMSIDTNGIITWTPTEAQGPSTNVITTVVTDAGEPALSATNSFTLIVEELNVAPVLTTQVDHVLAGPQPLVVTNSATDPDLPANGLHYALAIGPAGAAIDTYGVVSWTPSVAQVPSTNLFEIVVSDSNPWAVNEQQLSATNRFTVVVDAIHNGPTLPPQDDLMLNEGTMLIVINTAQAADIPALGLSYRLLSPPAGASIDADGVIIWTPSEDQGPSTNLFTTVVTDSGVPAISVTNSFTVHVNEVNLPPLLPVQAQRTLAAGQPLVVANAASDPDLPANHLTYQLLAAPSGAAINANGVITWTPATTQEPGTNLFRTVVTDDNPDAINLQHLSATNSFIVVVTPPWTGPVLPQQPGFTIAEGTTLVITNTAVNTEVPPSQLTYSLLNPPAGAAIDSQGVITWTPSGGPLPSTNTITTVVVDDGSPALSATNSFSVVVLPPQIVIQSIQVAQGMTTIRWNSAPNRVYRLQYKEALTESQWQDVLPELTATERVTSATNRLGNGPQRFYRIQFVR